MNDRSPALEIGLVSSKSPDLSFQPDFWDEKHDQNVVEKWDFRMGRGISGAILHIYTVYIYVNIYVYIYIL